MSDRSTSETAAEVREALARLHAAESPEAAVPLLTEALESLLKALDRLAERERNLAIQQALLDDRLLRVERSKIFTAVNRTVAAAGGVLQQARRRLATAPQPAALDPAEYDLWVAHEQAALPSAEQARGIARTWNAPPKISVLMLTRGPAPEGVAVESIHAQAFEPSDLCAAPLNGDWETAAWHSAASAAQGDYLVFLPEDAALSPLALYFVAEALQSGEYDLLYSDEDLFDATGHRTQPIFKPDWSPELSASSGYPGNLLVMRRELFLREIASAEPNQRATLDRLVHRLAAGPMRVCHIPRVLYHGPPHRRPADVGVRLEPSAPQREETTAIICSRSPLLLAACLKSLRETAPGITQIVVVKHEQPAADPAMARVLQEYNAEGISYRGPFHFAHMCNLGAELAQSPHLLFLNDDITATQPNWAELLNEQLRYEDVGVAGAVLWYPSGTLQHAGIVTGILDGAGHLGRLMSGSELWPWLTSTREVSAVTGACLAIRRDLFQDLDGFDTAFPNNYNDVDLCLRARARDYRVVCVSTPGLIHAECQTRAGIVRFNERFAFYGRWAGLLAKPDPYYSTCLEPGERIALNLTGDDWHRSLL